jgi:hypothetical protein
VKKRENATRVYYLHEWFTYSVTHALLLPVSLLCFRALLPEQKQRCKSLLTLLLEQKGEKQQLNIALNIGTEYCFTL